MAEAYATRAAVTDVRHELITKASWEELQDVRVISENCRNAAEQGLEKLNELWERLDATDGSIDAQVKKLEHDFQGGADCTHRALEALAKRVDDHIESASNHQGEV